MIIYVKAFPHSNLQAAHIFWYFHLIISYYSNLDTSNIRLLQFCFPRTSYCSFNRKQMSVLQVTSKGFILLPCTPTILDKTKVMVIFRIWACHMCKHLSELFVCVKYSTHFGTWCKLQDPLIITSKCMGTWVWCWEHCLCNGTCHVEWAADIWNHMVRVWSKSQYDTFGQNLNMTLSRHLKQHIRHYIRHEKLNDEAFLCMCLQCEKSDF